MLGVNNFASLGDVSDVGCYNLLWVITLLEDVVAVVSDKLFCHCLRCACQFSLEFLC